MTWSWTFTWSLLNPARKPEVTGITGTYLMQLSRQLTPARYLYAEVMWRDPIDECLEQCSTSQSEEKGGII